MSSSVQGIVEPCAKPKAAKKKSKSMRNLDIDRKGVPNWQWREVVALVRAARSASERYKQTDLSLLEKAIVETYEEKLKSVCTEYGELTPSNSALTVQKHGQWLSGVAGPLRAAIGG